MVQYLDHIDTPKDTAQSWAIMGNIVKLALSVSSSKNTNAESRILKSRYLFIDGTKYVF